MILTKEERERFALYLEEMAHSDELIAEQLKRLLMPNALIQSNIVSAAAARMVVKRLRSTESDSIGSPASLDI